MKSGVERRTGLLELPEKLPIPFALCHAAAVFRILLECAAHGSPRACSILGGASCRLLCVEFQHERGANCKTHYHQIAPCAGGNAGLAQALGGLCFLVWCSSAWRCCALWSRGRWAARTSRPGTSRCGSTFSPACAATRRPRMTAGGSPSRIQSNDPLENPMNQAMNHSR